MTEAPPGTSAAAVVSMTGYAHAEGSLDAVTWSWDLRSVNGRGLDLRLRLPGGCESIEPKVREAVARYCRRGSVSAQLDLQRRSGGRAVVLDRALLDRVLALHLELAGRVDPAPPRLEALLAIRGMLVDEDGAAPEVDTDARDAAMLASLEEACRRLERARRDEGARLAAVVAGLVARIAELTAAARALAELQPRALADRLRRQLAELVGGSVAVDRLEQEIALLAARADPREELDRLDAHVAAARALLAEGGPCGRKLDFLAQEFNREANTLTAKSGDIELTRLGLELKSAIDQFREQIQNLE